MPIPKRTFLHEWENKEMESEPKKLITVNNRVRADYIVNTLKDNHVPSYIKEYGTGSMYGAYFGFFTDSGIDIYVPETAYEAAMEVLNFMGIDPDEE